MLRLLCSMARVGSSCVDHASRVIQFLTLVAALAYYLVGLVYFTSQTPTLSEQWLTLAHWVTGIAHVAAGLVRLG